jgi:hypothetical protein
MSWSAQVLCAMSLLGTSLGNGSLQHGTVFIHERSCFSRQKCTEVPCRAAGSIGIKMACCVK